MSKPQDNTKIKVPPQSLVQNMIHMYVTILLEAYFEKATSTEHNTGHSTALCI